MAINLLIAAGASKTGAWTRIEPSKSVDYPARVTFVSGTGGNVWSAGNVILEELVGGLPGNGNSPYPPRNDTGTVLPVGSFASGAGDFQIDAPIDFIRARTDSGIVGTVSVFVTMNS